ncbi:hypothetical protein [Streptomyces erythrochromogenes]|uniref:hypothetical protein n=1 Tax=Streptomyces erythrochromogenes TaxID=285574 RepID=UPI0038651D07
MRGLVGDRLYAVRDGDGRFGSGKNTRRFRRMDGLLHLRSRFLRGQGGPGAEGLPELIAPGRRTGRRSSERCVMTGQATVRVGDPLVLG